MFNTQDLNQIQELISTKKNIVIVTHYNPDGDAIGGSLGLKHFLNNQGVDAEVITPNDFPKFLKWMPDAKKITIAEYKKKKAFELIDEADVIFCLDFNTYSRIGILGDWVSQSKAKKILIDHHQQPDNFDFVYSDTQVPATSQMVYHFIEALGKSNLVDENVAKCLYTGIMTDTGGFRYRSTSATTHRITAYLIEKGANPAEISSNTWDNNNVSRLKLLSLVLGRIELTKNNEIAILWLKRKELLELGFEKGDTEGFVNYGLSVLGVKVSALFMEDLYEELIKISFRSKNNVDVNQFARKYFSGGGHINAAGGKSYESIEKTIERFKEIVNQEEF
ncbi:MAG: bifunctional oligoribonuclease/PAP phosphatase NrnA [Flavobacteriaceae bacterium]|nr:bifunctional oligoribonuclease/PAP phosphatase NrnA [Flavobacteriaceae bacterium]